MYFFISVSFRFSIVDIIFVRRLIFGSRNAVLLQLTLNYNFNYRIENKSNNKSVRFDQQCFGIGIATVIFHRVFVVFVVIQKIIIITTVTNNGFDFFL